MNLTAVPSRAIGFTSGIAFDVVDDAMGPLDSPRVGRVELRFTNDPFVVDMTFMLLVSDEPVWRATVQVGEPLSELPASRAVSTALDAIRMALLFPEVLAALRLSIDVAA